MKTASSRSLAGSRVPRQVTSFARVFAVFTIASLALFAHSDSAVAQDFVGVRWVLQEVRVNEKGVLPEFTYQTGFDATTTDSVSVSSTSINWTTSRVHESGTVERFQDVQITFTQPPSELVTHEDFEITINATAVCRFSEDYPGVRHCGSSIIAAAGPADSDGEYTAGFVGGDTFDIRERDVGSGITLTDSFTSRLIPPNGRRPLSDSYYRVEVSGNDRFAVDEETGHDSKYTRRPTVAWIYRAQELPATPTPTTSSFPTATPRPVATADATAVPTTTSFDPSGPLDASCEIDHDEFDDEWIRYSDIDDRIPLRERSFEAREYDRVASRVSDLTVEGFELESEMEIDRLMRLELREYRQALVRNIKTNLLKAFWRLSYVTYSTIKKGSSMGQAYGKALTSASSIKQLGTGIQTVQGLTPPAPSYSAPDMKARIKTQLQNAAMSPGLQILTADSPADFGKSVFNDMQKAGAAAFVPSADISEEEISILRTQHLEERVLDDVLQESYRLNSKRRERVQAIEAEIGTLREEMQDWADQEKERVARSLQASCEARR